VACLGLAASLQRFADGHPTVIFLAVAMIGVAVAVPWGASRNSRRPLRLGVVAFLITFLVLLILTSGTSVQGDESLYTRFATELMGHGGNPYVSDVATSALHYAAPASGLTANWDGSVVGAFPYPAGLLWLTWIAGAVPYFATPTVALNAVAVIAIFMMMWRRCGWQSVAIYSLILMSGEQLGVLARGNSDIVIVPFFMWLMHKVSTVDPNRWSQFLWFGSVLGIALSIKQNAWLLAPFLLIALRGSLSDRGVPILRPLATIISASTAVFVACNLPYILRSGSAWFQAVLSPFHSDGVPAGQGMISIPLHFGGDLSSTFVVMSFTTTLLALVIALTLRGRPSLLMVMGGVVPTLVSSRSFLHYIITLTPLVLVALSQETPPLTPRRRTWAGALFVPALVGLIVLWSGATPQSDITLRRYALQPGTTNVAELTVRVAEKVQRHATSFMVSHDGNPFQDWIVTSQHRGSVTLRMPVGAEPLNTSTPFQVTAVDRVHRYRYVSAPTVIAPISVLVGTTSGGTPHVKRFTVNLAGPKKSVARVGVRVFQTEVVKGGLRSLRSHDPYVFVGRTGRDGAAHWKFRCARGSRAKVSVEVLDGHGQTIYRTPLGIFSCKVLISTK